MRGAASVAVGRLRGRPDADALLAAGRPGAALLEGWSDEAGWRIVLPWPEEIRTLSWEDACDWKALVRSLEQGLDDSTPPPFPFTGGWVGFLAYEATACEEDVRPRVVHPPEPPLFFARHRAGVLIAPDGAAFLFAPPGTAARYTALLDQAHAAPRRAGAPAPIVDSLAGGAHRRMVEAIRAAIRDGDVYQVNLTRAFSTERSCDPAELYRALTGAQPPRSAALLHGDGWSIASASPELLLRFDRAGGVAESRPIKGTVRREGEEGAEIRALLASTKDAAEHLMIVDVVRNDFGKIAPAGQVTVPEYRAVRSLEHVHHLESTVRATGLEDASVANILAALSPPASITGAPKRAAVRMIRELEPVPRGVYCGSIGMIHSGGATFSVAIRTAVCTPTSVRYHAGGGIVWDSDAAAEDDESRAKSSAFLRYLGEAGT